MKRRSFVSLPALALAGGVPPAASVAEGPSVVDGMPVFAEQLTAELTFPPAYRHGDFAARRGRARAGKYFSGRQVAALSPHIAATMPAAPVPALTPRRTLAAARQSWLPARRSRRFCRCRNRR